nr:alpha-hydroxy-acid oxidizing protein [Sciscionella marina]
MRGQCLSNYTSDPAFPASSQRSPEDDSRGAVLRWMEVFKNLLNRDCLDWLRSLSNPPLTVKGIRHPDDVRRAKDSGVDGIYCSAPG